LSTSSTSSTSLTSSSLSTSSTSSTSLTSSSCGTFLRFEFAPGRALRMRTGFAGRTSNSGGPSSAPACAPPAA
jgi:hypothetical protein